MEEQTTPFREIAGATFLGCPQPIRIYDSSPAESTPELQTPRSVVRTHISRFGNPLCFTRRNLTSFWSWSGRAIVYVAYEPRALNRQVQKGQDCGSQPLDHLQVGGLTDCGKRNEAQHASLSSYERKSFPIADG